MRKHQQTRAIVKLLDGTTRIVPAQTAVGPDGMLYVAMDVTELGEPWNGAPYRFFAMRHGVPFYMHNTQLNKAPQQGAQPDDTGPKAG